MKIKALMVCDCFKITDPATGKVVGRFDKMPKEFYENPSEPVMLLFQKDSCGNDVGATSAIFGFTLSTKR